MYYLAQWRTLLLINYALYGLESNGARNLKHEEHGDESTSLIDFDDDLIWL